MKHLKLMNIVNSKSDRSNTGYKGITFRKDNGKFQAQVITYSTKKVIHNSEKVVTVQKSAWSRSYDTLKEAITAREQYILNLL